MQTSRKQNNTNNEFVYLRHYSVYIFHVITINKWHDDIQTDDKAIIANTNHVSIAKTNTGWWSLPQEHCPNSFFIYNNACILILYPFTAIVHYLNYSMQSILHTEHVNKSVWKCFQYVGFLLIILYIFNKAFVRIYYIFLNTVKPIPVLFCD